MNLYYEIMHKVEFEYFVLGYVKAKTKSHSKDLAKDLRDFLMQATGTDWNVELYNHSHIISVFDKLVGRLKESEDWQMITKYFPDAEVKDIGTSRFCEK